MDAGTHLIAVSLKKYFFKNDIFRCNAFAAYHGSHKDAMK